MIAIDLFAGAGGFSTGAVAAGCTVVWAANHWPAAVQVHADNHAGTKHACQDLQQADWTQVPAHDLLLASPACQGHSRARGKEQPRHDAMRATAWAVVSAAECHRPAVFVVENVAEFADWTLYPAWCAAMHALGYALAPMVIDAADHGVPQHRERLIIVGTRSRHPIELQLARRAHVSARSVIDFEAGTWSLINKPGRAVNTLDRIAAGRRRFGVQFVAPYYGSGSGLTGRSLDRPIGTVTTKARWAIVNGDRMRMATTAENCAFMGFPRTYRLPASPAVALHMLGNAVPPPVATDIINSIRRAV